MAKTKAKKSTKGAKDSIKRASSSSKKPSKSTAAKKRSAAAAAKPASASRRSASGPVSTDIRQAYKSFLLGDYLGEKRTPSRTGKKTR